MAPTIPSSEPSQQKPATSPVGSGDVQPPNELKNVNVAPLSPSAAQGIAEQEAYEIVRDGYVYAYPLLLMVFTWRQLTNREKPTGIPGQGPPNQFSHSPQFTPAEYKAVVRANVDTLYSIAQLDVAPEPLVLTVPAVDRYFMLPINSAWTDVFAVPGTRTTGRNVARDFLLAGPRWIGQAPAGLEIIRCPTRYLSIVGRTQTNGVADYDSVHKIQARYRLTPLSAWGEDDYVAPPGKVDPAIDMKTPPPVQVDKMDAAAYFGLFAELLKDNPPNQCDYPIIHRLERIGFKPGSNFDLNAASAAIRRAAERGTTDGKAAVAAAGKRESGEGGKGWVYTTRSGAYGVDYLYRAAIAYSALGENLAQDAVYPALAVDSEGRPLDGNNNYLLHFDKGKLPPVDAFWSVTAYDTDGYMIPNPLKRQALGDRDKLLTNNDGSLDLYIQASPPGGAKDANWLPVAKAPFTLLLRLYSPKSDVLEGRWAPPQVRHAD